MSIKRHTLQNLAGSMVPMLVSFLTVPVYLHLIGPARYGVLAIVWLFLGYFSVFDMGLARASSYHLARLHGAPPAERVSVFYTALALNAAFGSFGALVMFAVARPLFLHVFHMPPVLSTQVIAVLPWVALAIPLTTISGVFTGALQAREHFAAWNIIGAFNTLLTQLAPLAVAFFHGPNLTWLIPAVVIARVVGFIPLIPTVAKSLPLGQGGAFNIKLVRALFGYGSWVFVSTVINPVLTTMDRMLIGGMLGADAVAYYSVPFNLVSRLSTLAAALPVSLLPRMSRQDSEATQKLAAESLLTMAAALTPVIVAATLAMPIFLRLWVGAAFAARAAPVGIALMPGIWVNCLAFIVFDQLQATNRPDLTAKFHLLEIIPFLATLYLGITCFGLVGAAAARSLRMCLDAGLLFHATGQGKALWRILPGAILVLLALPLAPTMIISPRTGLAILLFTASCAWALAAEPRLRGLLRSTFFRLTHA